MSLSSVPDVRSRGLADRGILGEGAHIGCALDIGLGIECSACIDSHLTVRLFIYGRAYIYG